MEINQLILIIKKKLEKNIVLQDIKIEDKSFLHKKHLSNQEGKYHLRLSIKSLELKKQNKVQAYKKVYNNLKEEIKKYIHSIQILIR